MNRSELLAQVKERKGLALVDTGGHYNFIDTNNRLFGFDMEANCCEDFDCVIEWNEGKAVSPESYRVEGAQVSFFPGVFFAGTLKDDMEEDEENDSFGGRVECPLLNDKSEEVGRIVAYNHHNGYYYHDIEHNLTDDGQTVEISL